jgi:hypothetical protein
LDAEEFLDYKDRNSGGEIGLRLPARLYLSGGYQYVKTEREFIKESQDPDLVLPFNREHHLFCRVEMERPGFYGFQGGLREIGSRGNIQKH